MKLIHCFLLLIILSFSHLSLAEDKKEYALQERTYRELSEIQKLMSEDKLSEALSRLQKLISKTRPEYDMAIANQTLGYLYYQLDKYQEAIAAFDKALSGSLPEKVIQELLYIKAQLLIHMEKYKQGLEALDKWFEKAPSPPAEAYLLKASAHYQLEQFKEIINPMKQALKMNRNAPANWFELLLAAFFETKQYRNATSMLELLIRRFPDNKDYWTQLITVYQMRKLDKKSLAVMELAYNKGYLQDREILAMAQNYAYFGAPYKAAMILDKEINAGVLAADEETLEILLTAWMMSQEYDKAIETLTTLNQNYPDEKYAYQLGQLYYDKQNWQQTVNSLQSIVTKKDIRNFADANLLYGIANAELKKFNEARKAFQRSLSNKTTRDTAKWWLEQIEEQRNQESASDKV